MIILGPHYGNAPAELIERHRAIAKRMGELFEANPQDPRLFELQEQAVKLEMQIREFNAGINER